MTPHALLPTGEALSFNFNLTFPPPPLSPYSVHCIAMDLDSDYKIPKPCLAEKQANRPNLSSFVCVHFQGEGGAGVSTREFEK